jgi:hypothetical protein
MSTLRVNTLQNTSGVEVYTAKAWVNFNGTGTVAIRASGNVSSITDNGTGDYTVNFTTALADANYATLMTTRITNSDTNGVLIQGPRGGGTYSTTAVRVMTTAAIGSSAGMFDADAVYVAIFR